MSYSIYIGEATLEDIDNINPEDYDGEFVSRWSVERETNDNAPEFENDTMTGKSNGRHPGYGAWADFAESVGLNSFFFDKYEGLMRNHPGCFALTKKHGEIVSKALSDYKLKYPNVKPGFTELFLANSPVVCSDARKMGASDETVATYHLARLIWLDWWIQWALSNCKRPAISNS